MSMTQLKKKMTASKSARTMVIAGIVLLSVLGIAIVILLQFLPKPQAAEAPALKVGETSISKETYNTMLSQAKEQGTSEPDAKIAIQESLRLREAMRRLGIEVPTYLVAAQAQTETQYVYTPYEQLTDYQKAVLYPKAAYVLLTLVQAGGSLATVFHAPYDTATNAEDNRAYAEQLANQVQNYKNNNATDGDGKPLNDPLRTALVPFTVDEHAHYAQGVNESGVVALSNDGQRITATDDQFTNIAKLPVAQATFAPTIAALTAQTKEGSLSAVTQLSSPVAYVVVNKDKTYAKDDAILTKLQTILQELKG